MRNFTRMIFIMHFCSFLVSCTNNDKVSTIPEDDLYDIYYLKEAPKTSEKQDVSEVIKVVLTKNEELMDETIAIDMEQSKIHLDPSIQASGVRTSNDAQDIDDVQVVLDMLEKYQVQDWEEDYSQSKDSSTTDDGVGWSLYLQFKDGTVQQHIGSGTSMKSITPEEFDTFSQALRDFVQECLEDEK